MINKNDSEFSPKKKKLIINDINEVNFFKRTIDNYTHEDISDKKINKITSWRKSQKKFFSFLILNLLTFGILHFISKCYPKLYLKLYCNICTPKTSDFFLIEDIYGNCILCETKKLKNNLSKTDLQNLSYEDSTKAYMCLYSSWNVKNLNINLANDNSHSPNDHFISINSSQIISFIYNSKSYEYDEVNNKIIPVYLNLEGKTNKNIINSFQGGLASEYLVNKIQERFGKNEFKLNFNIIHLYFEKVEKKLFIYSIILIHLEMFARDATSFGIVMTFIIGYFIFRKIFLWKVLKKYNEKDFTLDGEKSNKYKVKRKYLFKIHKDKDKEIKREKKIFEDNNKFLKNNLSNYIHRNNSKNRINSNSQNNIIEKEMKEEEDNYQYSLINNSELLPGDIIYLKKGEFVPCDGIILDGDCVVNEIEINEKIEYTYKTYLKYTNDKFDYKSNKSSILLHGTKIIKIYRKKNISDNNKQNKFITVLCINIGPNTYKANQISNALDILERKKEYKSMYKIMSGQRLIFIISISTIFFLAVLIPTLIVVVRIKKYGIEYLIGTGNNNPKNGVNPQNTGMGGPPSNYTIVGSPENNEEMQIMHEMKANSTQSIPEEAKRQILKEFLINYFLNFFSRIILKSYMPIYYIISSFIFLLESYRLYKMNIFCFEKMRILLAGEINTIFMSKINILSDTHYEIKGYYPAFQASKFSNITLQEFLPEQLKDFSSIIFNYYNNIKNNKESFVGLTNINSLNKISGKLSVWFLECLFCCNNLIKIRHDIQGNLIEKNLIKTMKWDIKIIEEENNISDVENYIYEKINNNSFENISEKYNSDNSDDSKLLYYGNDKEKNYTYNKIMDVFPENYYKMIDKKNYGYQKLISRFKFFLSKSILKRSNNLSDKKLLGNRKSLDFDKKNLILKDLTNEKCTSYKLRIYKKFLTRNSLFSSAIVYNFYLKTLRFMIKGPPEKIIPCCLINTLPENICQIISDFRKDGYIILICASKKIDIYSYNDSDEERSYMSDLTFCGFITLKNKINNESKRAIEELKKMNCQIIMNTGDNLYNSIGTGFEIGILENKKIFSFDFDDNKKQLYVDNTYRPSSYDYEINEKIQEIKRKRHSSKYFKKVKKRDLPQPKLRNGEINNSLSNNTNKNEDIKNSMKIKNLNQQAKFSRNRVSQNTIISNNSKFSSNNNDSFISSDRVNILNKTYIVSTNEQGKNDINNNIRESNNMRKSINNDLKEIQDNIFPNSQVNRMQIKSMVPLDTKSRSKMINNSFLNNNDKKNTFDNTFNELKYIYSFSHEVENNEFEREKYIKEYFSNISYFSESFFKNLQTDLILCISGKAFKYIYENKEDIKYSNLLKILPKYAKIFFSMSSKDKSFLIDYFRELPNKKTCMIGYGSSDIDSIMTAHVGICLKKPNNVNTMLSHFYLPSQDLMNVKTIIEHGRAIFENLFLLFISCLFCITVIDLYVVITFCILLKVGPEHLRMFNVIFYTLSIFGFTNSSDDKKKSILIQNNKLFFKYGFLLFFGNILIKLSDILLFFYLHRKNSHIEIEKRNSIFISYYALLTFNLIFTTLFGFNYIRFYRKHFYDNILFCFSLMLLFILILVGLFFSGPGYKNALNNYYIFENSHEKSNTFDDRNKLVMLIIIIIDLLSTILFITIIQYLFNKKSKNIDIKKKEINI